MRKAFCGSCNACLEYQDGYDDDNTCWVCTECGAISYSGVPRFPGVIWKCDRCGDLLNNQYGFDDYEDTWECEECGYENEISEDEIHDAEEDYEYSDYDDESVDCPNCGADLTDQDGFDSDFKFWKCDCCAEIVENPNNDDEEELHLCSECDAILNNQDGFDEDDDSFVCEECGHENVINGYENCPYCGSDLTVQDGFDEDFVFWKCEDCGRIINHVEDDSHKLFLCKGCAAILNNQYGFDEEAYYFYCENCGTENSISSDDYEDDDYGSDDYQSNYYPNNGYSSDSTTRYSSPVYSTSTSSNSSKTYSYRSSSSEKCNVVGLKGHSIILWIVLTLIFACFPWTIIFIIYYSLSPKHYWHA